MKKYKISFNGKFGKMEIVVIGKKSKNYLIRELEDKGYMLEVIEI